MNYLDGIDVNDIYEIDINSSGMLFITIELGSHHYRWYSQTQIDKILCFTTVKS